MSPLRGSTYASSYPDPRVARCALTLGYYISRFQREERALPDGRATAPTSRHPHPSHSLNPSTIRRTSARFFSNTAKVAMIAAPVAMPATYHNHVQPKLTDA